MYNIKITEKHEPYFFKFIIEEFNDKIKKIVEILPRYLFNNKKIVSRNITNINWRKISPSSTTVLKQNEFIIFNADIYHTWIYYNENNISNRRVTLKLRPYDNIDFETLKNITLNYFK